MLDPLAWSYYQIKVPSALCAVPVLVTLFVVMLKCKYFGQTRLKRLRLFPALESDSLNRNKVRLSHEDGIGEVQGRAHGGRG